MYESKVFWVALAAFWFLEAGPYDLTSCLRFFSIARVVPCFWSVVFLV